MRGDRCDTRQASVTIGVPSTNGKISTDWVIIREDDWRCKPWVRIYVITCRDHQRLLVQRNRTACLYSGWNSVALRVTSTVSLGSGCPQITLPRRLGTKEFSCGLTFVVHSRVTSLNGLLIVEKLDWKRVKKLGGKFLLLRLEDLAHKYPGT
jgi:hypothetical protein